MAHTGILEAIHSVVALPSIYCIAFPQTERGRKGQRESSSGREKEREHCKSYFLKGGPVHHSFGIRRFYISSPSLSAQHRRPSAIRGLNSSDIALPACLQYIDLA